MEYVIQTKNLVKRYGHKYAVNNVSINVRRGDIYGLIGRNGAGKTSLMKLILGMTMPQSGEIMLFDSPKLNEGRKKIGSLIESPGLYKNCTARENLKRFCLLYGADASEIAPLLELVGLSDTGNKTAGEFSLGMRQRLGIAIALLAKPDVLVLDEPINGLDPAGIKDIRDLILKLHGEGVTFIISSHLLDELAKVVTNYGIIADGVLTEEVTAKELNERCTKRVKIATDDNRAACAMLFDMLPELDAEVREDGLILRNYLDRTAEINRALVERGFEVSQLAISENGLEEYFIARLGK